MSLGRVAQFELVERLGEGGMGEVFRAIDTMLEREVAIKALRPELAARPELVERFRVEAIALARLNHPNIATVYNFLQDHGTYYMVMLFVRGRTLEQLLEQRKRLPWPEALQIVAQTLRALQHAHGMGVVHRDLKPANLMVRNDGTVVVMDFGIARVLARERQTRSGNLVGTLEYMSPEQVQGKDVDGRSDLYSLGVMLYEMLSGRLPFIASTDYELLRAHVELTPPRVSELCPDLPEPVEQLVRHAMAKEPRQRLASADQFLHDVQALLPSGAAAAPVRSGLGQLIDRLRHSLDRLQGAVVTALQMLRPAAAAGGRSNAALASPTGVTLGPGGGRPHRWSDTAITQAKRNPGLAIAFLLGTAALALALAGALGSWRKPAPAPQPDVPGKTPPSGFTSDTPPSTVPQKYPGVTIVEDKPKTVEPFPKSGESGTPGAPPARSPPTNAPPSASPPSKNPTTNAPSPPGSRAGADDRRAPAPAPPPAQPPAQRKDDRWYVR